MEVKMRFDIYGRFRVEVRREHDAWVAYRSELGKRARLDDVVIPPDLVPDDIGTYLDDVFHEFAGIGQSVERLAD
jgi:hypothetical protein